MTASNKIVFDFIRKNKWLVGGTLGASFFSNLLSVLLPVSIGKFYELALHDGGSVKGKLLKLLPVEVASIRQFFIFFGALIVLKVVFSFFEKYGTGVVTERFARRLRERVFSAQLSHTLAVHSQKPVGKYLLRYSGDLRTVQNYLNRGILSFTGDVFFMLCAFTGLWMINPRLTLIAMTVFSVAGILIFFLSRRMRLASVERRNQRSKTLDFVSSRLSAFYTIKSFNRESVEEEIYDRRSRKQYKAGVNYFRISSFIQSLIPGFFFGALALMLAMIVRMDAEGVSSTYGDVLVFVLLFLYMQGVTRRLLRVNLVWQEGKISLNKLTQLFSQPRENRLGSDAADEIKGGISFNNVTFAYAEKPVLKNITFAIQPGNLALIKGKQGAGKSTMLKLIQKMYEPQQGEIFMDNMSYNSLSPFEIRKEVTIVSSETPLLGNTVFRAISYRDTADRRENASKILKKLHLQFAADENENLNFKLDEKAKNISDGQKIMLQFARALLTNKKIILLDEPFQNLDAEARDIIVERLNKLRDKRTIILISDYVPSGLAISQTIQL